MADANVDDALKQRWLRDMCDSLGLSADALPPHCRQLALVALDQAQTLVLTYLVSHLKNTEEQHHE